MGKSNKLTSLFIAGSVLASAAAGCSSETTSSSGSSSSPSASPVASTAPSEKPKEKVEITFWHVYSDKDSGPLNEAVDAFNKANDHIMVKALSNQDATKQLTAISGGNPPDIALTFWNNVGPWADVGAIQELDTFFTQDKYDTKQYVPAAIERMKVNGKYYGLPFTMSMSNTLLYNKKNFADAGLAKPPETLEEMFEYAKKLTKKDANGITQIGFIPDFPWIDNVFWPVIFGGSWVDADGKVTPNKKENVDSIAYQRKFYEEFGNDAIEKYKAGMGKRGTPQDPLLTGQLSMMIGWEYNYPAERVEGGPIGVAPFPYPASRPELKGSGFVSPRAVFIPKKAKHQKEAWEFMRYLLSADTQVQYALKTKTIPTITSALDDKRLKTDEMKSVAPYYEWAKNPNLQGFPNSVYINEYLQSLSEETEKALKGSQTPQQAMDNVAKKIQPVADKAKNKQ